MLARIFQLFRLNRRAGEYALITAVGFDVRSVGEGEGDHLVVRLTPEAAQAIVDELADRLQEAEREGHPHTYLHLYGRVAPLPGVVVFKDGNYGD